MNTYNLNHDQSVIAQTQDQSTFNLQNEEDLIQKENRNPHNIGIEIADTQQLEISEPEEEPINIGVSIGYNTFVVTALALLITILSIVLTIGIFVLGFSGYSKIKEIKGKLVDAETEINEKKQNMDAELKNLKTQINERVSELQTTVSSEEVKTEKLREMIYNVNYELKQYIQAEAAKMNRLAIVDTYIQMKDFEQALREIEDFENKHSDEKELLRICKLNKAMILCNQEYDSKNYDLSLKCLEELLDWSEYKVEIYNLIAYCYSEKYYDSNCKETNLIKQAKEHLKQLDKITAKKITAKKNPREIFNLKINLGYCEIHLGNFREALEYFEASDNFVDGINPKNFPSQFYLWRAGKLICYLYYEQYKTELEQEFEKFITSPNEWNNGLRFCKQRFKPLGNHLNKLEQKFNEFKFTNQSQYLT